MSSVSISDAIHSLEGHLQGQQKLRSILSDISLEEKNTNPSGRYWNARFLDIDNIVRDIATDPIPVFTRDKMELERWPDSGFTWFHFAQKFGSRIPAEGADDVSYFDELRVNNIKDACGPCESYLLIKGDFSGIQDFIYGGIPIENPGGLRQVSKKLRGKSFFVAVITDFFAEIVLERLGLPHWNLLFAGGGHFNILAPWSKENEAILSALSKEINLQLRNDTDNRLSMILAAQKCSSDIFNNASKEMEAVNILRDALKDRQHIEYLNQIFFGVTSTTSEPDFESIGEDLPKTEHLLQVISDARLPLRSSGLNKVYELFIRSTQKYISIYTVRGQEGRKDDAAEAMCNFLKKQEISVLEAKIISLNTFDFLELSSYFLGFSFPIHFGFRLVGKEAPKNKKGELIDFEELSKSQKGIPPDPTASDAGTIYPQLAVVRLDVDDLGCLFSKGLHKKPDLRHFAAFSRELSLFFSGHFNRRAKDYDMYVVYSGGDDAFVVGNWACTLHFIEHLYRDFNSFTGNNRELHFSAGIFMCDEHFPVARFAEEAGILEKTAKDHDTEKNKVFVFNHIMPFKNYAITIDFALKVMKYTRTDQHEKGGKELSRGLIYRLLTLIRRSFHDKPELVDGQLRRKGQMRVENFYKNKAGLHYLFARHQFDEEKTNKSTDELSKEIIQYFINNWREEEDRQVFLKDAVVALQYVMYRKRKPKNT